MRWPGIEVTVLFALLICIFAVVIVAYQMGGADWETTGSNIAYVSVGLVFFAIAVAAAKHWRK